MPNPYTNLIGMSISTYTLLVSTGIVISILLLLCRHRRPYSFSQLIDVCIGGVAGGMIAARALHILSRWNYFATHTDEIVRFAAGGLDWHGAVIGGLMGMWLMGRLRGVALHSLLSTLSLVLPIMAFASWWGCEAAACAYGAEVINLSDYPSWLVWEGSDIYGLTAPRFYTQSIGTLLAFILFVMALALHRRSGNLSFGIILILLSAGMFGIGFLRGDSVPVFVGLRLDQWFDLCTALLGLILFRFSLRNSSGSSHNAEQKSTAPSQP